MLKKIGSEVACSPRSPVRLVSLLVLPVAFSCADAQSERISQRRTFACLGGATFSAEPMGKGVRVTTAKSAYELQPRRSSIGQKYASESVTLIIDENRAVFTGADEGDFYFRDCHER